MLLGIPWQIANKVSIEHKEDGTYIGFQPEDSDQRYEFFTGGRGRRAYIVAQSTLIQEEAPVVSYLLNPSGEITFLGPSKIPETVLEAPMETTVTEIDTRMIDKSEQQDDSAVIVYQKDLTSSLTLTGRFKQGLLNLFKFSPINNQFLIVMLLCTTMGALEILIWAMGQLISIFWVIHCVLRTYKPQIPTLGLIINPLTAPIKSPHVLLSRPTPHHSIMPRAVKSDSRARGTGGNQTPQTRSSILSPTPRATRSTSRVTLPPTSTSAHAASHTTRPPTRRSRRRTRKRGPGGTHPSRKPVAGSTQQSFNHELGASANVNSTRRTIKKPRLEDFESNSESDGDIGDDDGHDTTSLEHDNGALEHAHEMGALTMLIQVLSHLTLAPDVSENSQDMSSQPSNLNNDPLTQGVGESKAPLTLTHETEEHSPPFTQDESRKRTRHYGLLGERAASPFDEDIWKDWILTPLELRHSQAPREPEYDGFPGPGPLPPIPCVVRFDIVMRYPAKSLCMIGCARSDVSNGWVVTHSKSIIIDIDEAREFVDAIRYRADVTEVLGEGRKDAL